MTRALVVIAALFLCPLVRAADDPSSGKYHLAQAEDLARQGRAYEAAQEAQQAFWLDPSLKAQADAVLAKVHGGKGVDREFGQGRERFRSIAYAVLVTFAVLGLASRVRIGKHES